MILINIDNNKYVFYIFGMKDLHEQLSENNYVVVLRSLEERSKNTGFTIDMAKEELNSLYKYEGLDWDGRGDVLQAEIEGSILAYEVFISRNEDNNKSINL